MAALYRQSDPARYGRWDESQQLCSQSGPRLILIRCLAVLATKGVGIVLI
jgi:hypothetical protein